MSDHLKKVLFEKWVNFEAAEAVVVLLFAIFSLVVLSNKRATIICKLDRPVPLLELKRSAFIHLHKSIYARPKSSSIKLD